MATKATEKALKIVSDISINPLLIEDPEVIWSSLMKSVYLTFLTAEIQYFKSICSWLFLLQEVQKPELGFPNHKFIQLW